MGEPTDRILAKLAAARAAGVFTAFGAGQHRYVLGPPLAESVVAAFEEGHEVALPAAYRFFLTEVGDGGAGPGVGLTPLAKACADGCLPGHLRRPSPYRAGPRYLDDWEQRYEDVPGLLPGTLLIAYHGCTLETRLIVTGAERGRMFNLDTDGPLGPYLVEDRDFLAWYERWLDEAVAGFDVNWFGERLPLAEPELITVLADDPSPERRERAAESLTALPELSDAARSALVRAARTDDHPGVRVTALDLLRLPFPEDLAGLARASVPPDLRTLGRLRALTLDDVRSELAQADHERRRRAAYELAWDHHGRVTGSPEAFGDVAVRMLADSDPIVRSHGVDLVQQRRLHHLRPRLHDLLDTETDPWVRFQLDSQVLTSQSPEPEPWL